MVSDREQLQVKIYIVGDTLLNNIKFFVCPRKNKSRNKKNGSQTSTHTIQALYKDYTWNHQIYVVGHIIIIVKDTSVHKYLIYGVEIMCDIPNKNSTIHDIWGIM